MFGEFEECVETIVTNKGKVQFEGKHCQVLLKPLLPKVKKIPALNDRLEGLINATQNSSVSKRILEKNCNINVFQLRCQRIEMIQKTNLKLVHPCIIFSDLFILFFDI